MGWRERDYSQDTWTERYPTRSLSRWPAAGVMTLLTVHLAAFVGVELVSTGAGGASLIDGLALSQDAARVPGIFLHPLMTRSPLILVLTLFLIWSLGGRIEREAGRWRLFGLYFLGNVLAGAAFFGVARAWPILATLPLDYPAGALAAWAVWACRGMAGGMVAIFGRLWSVAHVVALTLAVCIGLTFAMHRFGATAWLVALAAGSAGELLASRFPVISMLQRRRHGREDAGEPSVRLPPSRPSDDPDIDDVLAKISRSGLDSLSQDDRERLEAARLAKLRKARGAGLDR